MEDIILLPRIRKIFENGSNDNVILYGSFGCGKTTLSRILIGKYSKNKPYIELNSSFYTSIDTLRSKIDEFCSMVYIGVDLDIEIDKDAIKYVFLDEFERTSVQYQDALKAYIEEYSSKNVRFILATNHISKISQGIRSRMLEINFDCLDKTEEKFLKKSFYKRIKDVICQKEGIDIPKEDIVHIIQSKFPDFRSTLIQLDSFNITGSIEDTTDSLSESLKKETFELITSDSDYGQVYNFITSKYGQDGIENLISNLGRPFMQYLLLNHSSIPTNNLFEINYEVCNHNRLLENSTDPIIVGMSLIGKIKEKIIK